MLPKKLAVPAAAILVLSGTVGLGRQGSPAHARPVHETYSGAVAITDYQFPDSLPLGGAYSAGVADVELAGAMVDGLLNFDATGGFYADLATDVPSAANGGIKLAGGVETVTYHLKPNQKWSDGSPVTNADWVGYMMLSFAPEYNATTGIDHIKTLTFSGNDMVITYKAPYAAALAFGLPSFPYPMEYMAKKYGVTPDPSILAAYDADKVDAYFKSAAYKGSNLQKFVNKWVNDSYISPSDIFNGPYKLAEWTPDQRVSLVPNTYYTALPADKSHPRPAKISFVVVSENANALVQAMSSDSTYSTIDKAEDFGLDNVPALKRSKFQILVPDALLYEHLELNTANPALKDARVRQALLYSLDKLNYLRALYPGLDSATYSKIALSSPLPSTSPWSNNNSLPKTSFDLAKAKSLLAAAGYANTPGTSGKHVSLNFYTTQSSFRIRSAQLLQRLWQNVGVNIKIHYATSFGTNGMFSKYTDGGVLYRRRFDVAEFAFSTAPDPDNGVNNYEPQYIPDANHPTGGNYAGINDPRITKDLEDAAVALDDAKRHAVYNDFQSYMLQQAYHISLFNRPNIIAVKGTIGNFQPNVTQAGSEWNAYQWYTKSATS